MSIDDDYFDVEAAVKGTPEEEAFDRITNYMTALELAVEAAEERLRTMNTLKKAIREFVNH